MDISFYVENLSQYMGSGLFFQLLLLGVLFLGFSMKKSPDKDALVLFPVYALLTYFCPIWILYMKLRSDGEILYRIIWMIPVAVIVCYAFVEYIDRFPDNKRVLAFLVAVILIVVSGKYIYANKQYKKAENVYHIPQAVIDICDEIIVPGREIGACFPIELIQYVRQYTAYVCQPYGRDSLIWGSAYDGHSRVGDILSEEVLDTNELVCELRVMNIPYIVVEENREMSEAFETYSYIKIDSFGTYDLYLDTTAYTGDYSDY